MESVTYTAELNQAAEKRNNSLLLITMRRKNTNHRAQINEYEIGRDIRTQKMRIQYDLTIYHTIYIKLIEEVGKIIKI